ncbi:carbohydrate porin [Candidatus Manganitrophus noduliformans]|nr:carbohydrate porin [Candidatus Manganitrophus noduliformans]
MKRWIGTLVLFVAINVGVSWAEDPDRQEDEEVSNASLSERVKALEERLDRLDRVETIKKVEEYLCPDGEIHDTPPPGGRCPDGTIPEGRMTFRKLPFSRRESLDERIAAALEEAEAKRVAVGGSARGILQQVLNSKENDKLFSTGAVDLFFLSRPTVFSTFFVDLESIGGAGPDEVLGSLSRLNADAETLGVTDDVKVREVWLHFKLLDDRLRIVGGKIDLTNYFDRNAVANDETSQFLNTALVNNPLLRQPPNGPGLAIQYDTGGEMGVALGIQSPNDTASTITEKVYAVVEIDYHSHLLFAREGNYRLWGRVGRVSEALEKKTWGVGFSLDQQITVRLTLFARAGIGRTEGENQKAYAWSAGFQTPSPFKASTRDQVGVAFSREVEADQSENIAEGYYHHILTDRLWVSLDLQWLISGTNGMTGDENENIFIPGVRTTVNF